MKSAAMNYMSSYLQIWRSFSLPLPAWQGALLPRKVFFHPFSLVLLGSAGQGARQCLGCKELGAMGGIRLVLLRVWCN